MVKCLNCGRRLGLKRFQIRFCSYQCKEAYVDKQLDKANQTWMKQANPKVKQ